MVQNMACFGSSVLPHRYSFGSRRTLIVYFDIGKLKGCLQHSSQSECFQDCLHFW